VKRILMFMGLWVLSGCAMILPSPTYPVELQIEGMGASSLNGLFENRNRWRVYKGSQWETYTFWLRKTEYGSDDIASKKFHVDARSEAYDVSVSKSPITIGEYVRLRIESKRLLPGQAKPTESQRTIELSFHVGDGSNLGISRIIEVADSSR
jgi:hypothetical protein